MNKKIFMLTAIIAILCCLAACGQEEVAPVADPVVEDIVEDVVEDDNPVAADLNIEEFVGWWSYAWLETGVNPTPPFFYAEIKADGNADFYGEYGEGIGSGSFMYNQDDDSFTLMANGGEYNVGNHNMHGEDYIVLDGAEHYSLGADMPAFPESEPVYEDPFAGSEGLWQAPVDGSIDGGYMAPYAFIEVSDEYVMTYDIDGVLIDEGILVHNEDRGLYTGYVMWYGDYAVSFGSYEDGMSYFDLIDTSDGTIWEYQVTNEFIGNQELSYSPIGLYQADEGIEFPFTVVEINSEDPINEDNISYMDTDYNILETGSFAYDVSQGVRIGNAVVVSFPDTGIYAAYFSEDGSIMYMADVIDWSENQEQAEYFEFYRQ